MIAVLAGLKPDATLTPELESSVQSRCRYYLSPAMRELIRWDAVKTMQLVDVPTLLIYGALDLNTDPGAATAFLASIEPQRAHRVQNVILDGLNHMLQEARTGEPAEANSLGSLSDRALNVITSWIAKLPSPVDHNSTRARPR